MAEFRWPLMRENVSHEDLTAVRYFLGQADRSIPRLTNGPQVEAFEREFARWLGTKYAVMVNSGASANLITMAAVRTLCATEMEVIVPTIAWSSDIASVLHAGLHPVFVDVDPNTLGMKWSEVYEKISNKTAAIFPTHVLGFNGLPSVKPIIQDGDKFFDIPMIEDCCEAIGARAEQRLGTYGLASNFSFYFAHHMSTIEGGMVCTDDFDFYQTLRMLRSHGLTRECSTQDMRDYYARALPSVHPEFIFALAGFNVRPTEINAVIGRSQLKRLDENIALRTINLQTWLSNLDPERFRVTYRAEGSSNYALPLILNSKSYGLMMKVLSRLHENEVEYRRGTAGGGNQLRQPYLTRIFGKDYARNFPEAEHIHEFGLYIGNYPELSSSDICALCKKLNAL